jgi:hypothetical protein
MDKIQVDASAVIDARAEAIYRVLADYEVGHAAIVPKQYFKELTVEKGGHGAGTVIRLKMNVYGSEFHYHQIVSEPEPGRIIKETDINTGLSSWFTLVPLGNGEQTRVTISSEFIPSEGFKGVIEKLFTPPTMHRIFKTELENLANYMHTHKTVAV